MAVHANLAHMTSLRCLTAIILPLALLGACAASPHPCGLSGRWVAPTSSLAIPNPLASNNPIVLLGEEHDRFADHAWELASITRLYEREPNMVLGFEMFPRATQGALDRWISGATSEDAFLQETDWKHVWGFDPMLYLPIFRFARDHHIPMVALNVSSHTIRLVSTRGSAAVSPADREFVGIPAPASVSYRAELTDVMSGHSGMAMTPERLDHFIDAQLTWDRAMAEAIAAQRQRAPGRPVVAIMGAGHLENRNGVPHQLEALGIPSALVLLPAHDVHGPFPAGYADAVYVEPSPDGDACGKTAPHV